MSDETKKSLEELLNAQEMKELEMFLERPIMVEAFKKVLFWPVTHQGSMKPGKSYIPNRNYLFNLVGSGEAAKYFITDRFLGKQLRIQWAAVNLVEKAFQEIESLRKVESLKPEVKNLAR